MNKLVKHFVLPVIVIVVGGLILDHFTSINIIDLFMGIMNTITVWLRRSFTIPIWGLILVALAISIIFIVIKILLFIFKKHKIPTYLNYRSANVFGLEWHWNYINNKIDEDSLLSRCPNCSSLLDYLKESSYRIIDDVTLSCPNCGFHKKFDYNLDTLIDRVVKEVDRRVYTGEYMDG